MIYQVLLKVDLKRMEKMDKLDLDKILKLHIKWLNEEKEGRRADLSWADLSRADLSMADLSMADLYGANLSGADLYGADLSKADLSKADLSDTKNMTKKIGVISGNCYYKMICGPFANKNYQFNIGLNKLKENEIFNSDERVLCAYPGFHFASESWCAVNYGERKYKALIKIPEDAEINEPWATDGKASADKIIIVKVWDNKTGEDVTEILKEKYGYKEP
jgi:hypothetical protein